MDLLVEFRETPGLAEYMGLTFWIEDGLGHDLSHSPLLALQGAPLVVDH